MTGPRWYDVEVKPPTKDGKYWVYPYQALSGDWLVTMASYEKGKWLNSRPQDFAYWQPILVPSPPKLKYHKQRGLD